MHVIFHVFKPSVTTGKIPAQSVYNKLTNISAYKNWTIKNLSIIYTPLSIKMSILKSECWPVVLDGDATILKRIFRGRELFPHVLIRKLDSFQRKELVLKGLDLSHRDLPGYFKGENWQSGGECSPFSKCFTIYFLLLLFLLRKIQEDATSTLIFPCEFTCLFTAIHSPTPCLLLTAPPKHPIRMQPRSSHCQVQQIFILNTTISSFSSKPLLAPYDLIISAHSSHYTALSCILANSL